MFERHNKFVERSTLLIVQLQHFVAVFVSVNVALKLSLNLA